jgi:hypothetical protein
LSFVNIFVRMDTPGFMIFISMLCEAITCYGSSFYVSCSMPHQLCGVLFFLLSSTQGSCFKWHRLSGRLLSFCSFLSLSPTESTSNTGGSLRYSVLYVVLKMPTCPFDRWHITNNNRRSRFSRLLPDARVPARISFLVQYCKALNCVPVVGRRIISVVSCFEIAVYKLV